MLKRTIKIFLASPSDVPEERKAVYEVIKQINEDNDKLELKLTSSDTLHPGHSPNAQGGQFVINQQTGDMKDYHLFVGIMKEKIGNQTKGGFKSGTVEEYERAYQSLQGNGRPDIWFYFPAVENEKQEFREFKEKKIKDRAFYKEYSNIENFQEQFNNHMKSWIEKADNNTLSDIREDERMNLIEIIVNEIDNHSLKILKTRLLFRNTKKLTEEQKNRLNNAIEELKSKLESEEYRSKLLSLIKDKQQLKAKENEVNYAAGNILNLLIKLDYRKDFSYFDLSDISIWEADLEEAILTGVDFYNSDLKNSSFSEPLGCIHSITFNADGTYFATGDAHGLIRVYKTESLETRILNKEGKNQIWSVAFGKTQFTQMLAWGAEDGSVKVLDIDKISDDSSSNNVNPSQRFIYESNEGRRILAVAFSPNGNLFAIGGDGDKAIRLVELNNNNSQKGNLDPTDVSCMIFINDDYIACGTQNGKIHHLSVHPQNRVQNRNKKLHTGVVRCIAFNKNESILASGGEDGQVKMVKIPGLTEVEFKLKQEISQVRTLAFSEDGNTLAIGYIDNENSKQPNHENSIEQSEHKILLLQYENNQWIERSKLNNSNKDGHQHLIRSIAFCPNDPNDPNKPKLLISGGDDRTVKLWDINTNKCQHTLSGYANRIWSVAINKDATTFACSGEDNNIRLWDYDKRTHIPTHILSKHTNWVWSVTFSPKDNILASASEDNKIFLWRFNGKNWEYTRELIGHNKRVRCVAFSPTKDILASAGNDNQVCLWDLDINITDADDSKSPKLNENSLKTPHKVPHNDRVLSLAFSPDGKYLASSSRDKTICLIDIESDLSVNKTPNVQNLGNDKGRHTDQVHSIAFSPNSNNLVLVSGGFDQKLKLWKVPSGESILSWDGHQKILSVAFHPNGEIVASAGDNHFITLWDISQIQDDKPKELKTLKGHKRTVESIAFSPDGKKLISCGQDQTIKFWQIDGDINISIHTIELGKPYQGMNIFGIKGLEEHQKSALEELGASRNV